MKTRGFVGLATVIAGLALAGWILSVAPDAGAQPGGHGKGKAAMKAGAAKGKAAKEAAKDEAVADPAEAKGKAHGKAAKEAAVPAEAEAAPVQGEAEAKGQDKVAAVKARIVKEQKKHLKNLARINRVTEIAEEEGKADLGEKAEMLRAKEYRRHQRVIDRLQHERRAAQGDPGIEKKRKAE